MSLDINNTHSYMYAYTFVCMHAHTHHTHITLSVSLDTSRMRSFAECCAIASAFILAVFSTSALSRSAASRCVYVYV